MKKHKYVDVSYYQSIHVLYVMSMCYVVDLKHLKYINVSHCQYMDDWCLDRLVDFRDSLLVLDISGCPHITERGIASLHRLQ